MKVKNSEDFENIINILLDLLKDKKISNDEITLRLRENHYCINCKQHFNRCKCDESDSPDSDSDTVSTSSYISYKSKSDSPDSSGSESPDDSDSD
jgi:hypothetical protein